MASSTAGAILAISTDLPGPTTPRLADTRLPTELLLDVFSLCEASSLLPTTCCALYTGFFKPGAHPCTASGCTATSSSAHNTTTTRNMALDRLFAPVKVRLNQMHEEVAQIDSIVAYYLKSRLPIAFGQEQHPLASGMAPPVPSNVGLPEHVAPSPLASVLSGDFVDWLFRGTGPFGRRVGPDEVDVVAELKRLRAAVGIDFEIDPDDELDTDDDDIIFAYHQVDPEDPEDADDSDDAAEEMEAVYNENGGDGEDVEDALDHENEEVDEGDSDDDSVSNSSFSSSASLVNSDICIQFAPTVRKWRLIPDALLLAHFFIRTSQLDMFERTLNHINSTLPTIATATAPFSVWSHTMLDNRSELRSCISRIVRLHNPAMSYPMFLCFLALVDWSKPALDIISRTFADTLDLPAVATFVTSNRFAFEAMTSTMHQLISPPSTSNRVLDILDWFWQHDARVSIKHFPTISPYIKGSYAIFADVFRVYDVPNLPRLSNIIARF